jgi:H+/Cl- antiporter ClcA
VAAAGLGIAVMKGVTRTEALFRRQAVPRWARPALGGLLLGGLALLFPETLGSGHDGILCELQAGSAPRSQRRLQRRSLSVQGFAAGYSARRFSWAAGSGA